MPARPCEDARQPPSADAGHVSAQSEDTASTQLCPHASAQHEGSAAQIVVTHGSQFDASAVPGERLAENGMPLS